MTQAVGVSSGHIFRIEATAASIWHQYKRDGKIIIDVKYCIFKIRSQSLKDQDSGIESAVYSMHGADPSAIGILYVSKPLAKWTDKHKNNNIYLDTNWNNYLLQTCKSMDLCAEMCTSGKSMKPPAILVSADTSKKWKAMLWGLVLVMLSARNGKSWRPFVAAKSARNM